MNDHLNISKAALISIVSEFINGYPNPVDPQPPGPWDPVIRQALDKMRYGLWPRPEPWRVGPASGPLNSLDWVLLNPQPLPPRLAYAIALADEVIGSVHSFFDIAEGMPSETQGQLQEVAVSRIHAFMDDCGNGRIPRWPFPWPPRDSIPGDPLSPVEMLVIGVAFHNAGQLFVDDHLRSVFQDAGGRMMDMAADQMG
jgi:hypothetical protein